jgi:hypothetical protein
MPLCMRIFLLGLHSETSRTQFNKAAYGEAIFI